MVVVKSQSKNIAKGMEAIQKTIGTKQSRVRIYDPRKEKMVSVAPYSANAKRLYKFYKVDSSDHHAILRQVA